MTPEELQLAKTRELAAAYKTAFGGDAGQLVLADLKKLTNFNRSHFFGPLDETGMNNLIYDEARRSLVLGIIARVEADMEVKPAETAITEEKV